MIPTLTVDDLEFEVRWSQQRKTIQITVDRGGELVITAPEGCDLAVMEEFVREKRFWLYTKLTEKEALQKPVTAKAFVTGEGFPYLGRSYRLLLVDAQETTLKLASGRFRLLRDEAKNGREIFVAWYTAHATRWLRERVERLASTVGVEPQNVEVRDLGFRWGSCGQQRNVNFHWATILLPPSVIEYVIVHELAHLHEPHHTPEFWLRVERAMPDYENRKRWIAEHGMAFAAL